jgi:AraC-like DNA-binding protein
LPLLLQQASFNRRNVTMLKLYGFSKVNAGARGHTRDPRVLWALEEMQLPFERRLRDIAAALGVGERRLQQLCHEHVGLAPKAVSRLARPHGMLRALRRRPRGPNSPRTSASATRPTWPTSSARSAA